MRGQIRFARLRRGRSNPRYLREAVATESYKFQRLFIRVSREALTFAVYHPFGGQPPVVESYEVNPTASFNVNLKEALASLPLAQEHFSRAEVLLNVPYTLKPVETFEEENAREIYKSVFHDTGRDRVFYDVAGVPGVALVYGMSDAFCRVIDDNFQTAHFTSSTTAVANRFAEAARGTRCNATFVYYHEQMADMFVFRAGRLLLGNRYVARSPEDAAYYVLLAVKTLGLDAEADEFRIVEQEPGAPLAKSLRRFLAHVADYDTRKVFGRTPLTEARGVSYDLVAYLMQPF